MAHVSGKKLLDFGSNPDHIPLWYVRVNIIVRLGPRHTPRGKICVTQKRKKNRILFTTTELTNKIDTLAEISMEGFRKARAIDAGQCHP